MPKIPAVTSRKMIKVLEKSGFYLKRTAGSHRHYFHPQKKILVTVPYHLKDLGRGLTKKILKDADVSVEEFLKLL